MSPGKVWPQPFIAVRDVPPSSAWYQHVLGVESGRGGDEYDQLVCGGELVLQLHRSGVDDQHGPIADPDQALGNGSLLWFEVGEFDAAVDRTRPAGARIVTEPHENPNARQQETWLRDPDGYGVVIAGPSADRPR